MASEYIHKCIALSHTATHCTVVKKEKLNKLISKKDKMIIYMIMYLIYLAYCLFEKLAGHVTYQPAV